MKIKAVYDGKTISLEVRKMSFLGKLSGLMFRTGNSENLLFEFSESESKAIHSFFVFFPFLALWLDKENKILSYNLVKPFTPLVKPEKNASKLIEIPLNKKNHKLLELLVGKGKI